MTLVTRNIQQQPLEILMCYSSSLHLIISVILTSAVLSGCGTVDDASDMPESNVINSNITSDRTLSSNPDHLVTANVCVENGATLTIEAGTQIMFESNASLQVCNDNSALIADGAESDPISMTATPGNETPGWWQGIGIFSDNPANSLEHVTVQHAGGNSFGTGWDPAGISLGKGAALTLSNSTLANNRGDGLNKGANGDASVTLNLSSNTYERNGRAALSIPFENASNVDGSSDFGSESYVRIQGGRTPNPSSGEVTIDALSGGNPYRFAGSVGVAGDATVTIEAGTEMQFAAGTNITVNSNEAALIADGTETDPVSMTTTPGDETSGWWQGVGVFSKNPSNELRHVIIRFAGGNNFWTGGEKASVGLGKGAQLSLQNSEIADSGRHGVICDNEEATLNASGTTFENIPGENVKYCQ